MAQPIRLGFIGASAAGSYFGGSWASRAHMPYLTSARNDGLYKVVALQNSTKESAERSVKAFELGDRVACYGDPAAIAADANVDVIAVSINVPGHYKAIMPALEAGKDMFVEWPLARNVADAEAMVKLVQEKKLRTMVGLQARQNPSVLAAKKLVDSGAIGEVLGTTMHGYGMILGEAHPESFAYGLPIENGANLMTIPFGHAIDALCYVLGELEYVQASLANRRPHFDIVDDKGTVVRAGTKTSHDFISVQGALKNGGGIVTAVYQGGMNPTDGPNFRWQIDGTRGSILLEGAMGHVQMYQPTAKVILKGEKEMRDVEGLEWVGDDFSYGVGKAWDAFARQRAGKPVEEGWVTTFEDALLRHKMIDAIYRSNEKGTREKYV